MCCLTAAATIFQRHTAAPFLLSLSSEILLLFPPGGDTGLPLTAFAKHFELESSRSIASNTTFIVANPFSIQ